jgi:modulator of FtsH protease
MIKVIDEISIYSMNRLKTTYKYVFYGILTAMLGAFLLFPYAASIVGITFWGLVIAEIAILIWFMFRKNIGTYLLFTLFTGMTLVPILAKFINAGAADVIVLALVGTAVLTGGLTYYAGSTTKNFLSMGQILLYILIGVVIMGLVNIFIGSSVLAMFLSIVTMVLFSFFIIHDTQQVLYTDIEPLDAAMGLYLSILNLFVSLLQILGIINGDD